VNVSVSSVEDLSVIENWSLFPNPTSGIARIRWNEATREVSRLEVTDSGGRLVYTVNIPTGSDQIEFDLSAYPSGVFNIRVISNAGVFTKKLVKTRI
jgi:hypothetical protein